MIPFFLYTPSPPLQRTTFNDYCPPLPHSTSFLAINASPLAHHHYLTTFSPFGQQGVSDKLALHGPLLDAFLARAARRSHLASSWRHFFPRPIFQPATHLSPVLLLLLHQSSLRNSLAFLLVGRHKVSIGGKVGGGGRISSGDRLPALHRSRAQAEKRWEGEERRGETCRRRQRQAQSSHCCALVGV